MHIAVCDDDKIFLETINEQLESIEFIDEISLFSNLDTFLFSVDGGKQYDAILMDIDWEKAAMGIDAAEELFRLCPETKIIYVTGFSDRFSQQIFLHRANLSGFLTKPVDPKMLEANLRKVLEAMPFQNEPALILRQRSAPVSIPLREIFYIESRGHTVEVHAAEENVTVYENLDKIMRMLPVGFYQCHKSYIVNLRQIRRFQPGEALLKNGQSVPVSRARYTPAKQEYFTFMGKLFDK